MSNNTEIISGFTFCIRGRDYFVPSQLVKRTKTFSKKILTKLSYPLTEANVNWMFDHIQKCDKEQTSYGLRICGDRYGNKFTLCIPYGEREDYIEMEVS